MYTRSNMTVGKIKQSTVNHNKIAAVLLKLFSLSTKAWSFFFCENFTRIDISRYETTLDAQRNFNAFRIKVFRHDFLNTNFIALPVKLVRGHSSVPNIGIKSQDKVHSTNHLKYGS